MPPPGHSEEPLPGPPKSAEGKIPSAPNPYDLFASIYDRHWQRFSIQPFPVLDQLLLRHLYSGAHILDLCCGTGQIAGQLLERGYRITGVDSSEGMLALARRNAPGARLVRADATSFTIPEPADAAISTSDSLNHITDSADLASALAATRAALRPGGRFVFDLNTEAKYQHRWTGSFGIVEDDHVCVVRPSYDPKAGLARFDATIFVPDAGHGTGWRREDFHMLERYYGEAEVRGALTDAGFADIAIFDWRRDLDPDGEPEKFFVVCRSA